jgi:RimJ/RimL family protein N-acetyltransferase
MAPITIRPLVPSDRRALVFAFRHLGERSRYQRFFTAKPELAPRDLARLLDVDHWHHEALIAFSPPPRAPIGIARYVRLHDDFEAAEVAITVVDEWQRHGVGTALLAALTERAVRAGIRHFSVSMLRDNAGARALAGRLGRPSAAGGAGGLVELVFDLGPTVATVGREPRIATVGTGPTIAVSSRVDHAPHPPHPGPSGVSSTSTVDETPRPR